MIILVFVGNLIIQRVDQLTWIELFLYAGVTFTLSVVVFWFVSLNKQSKEKILSIVQKKLSFKIINQP